jgi:hypothetical protein
MKGSTRAAVALGVGYVLGRNRKLRTAAMMAAATAVGGTSVGGLVMRRGAKMLVSSGVLDKVPSQLGDVVDTVRGDLIPAGKGAASAAVTSRIDSLTDSLHDRAERLRNPGAAVAEGAGAAGEAAGGAAGKARRGASGAAGSATRRLRGRGSEEDEGAEGEDEGAEEPLEDEPVEDEYAEDDYAEDEDELEEREPARGSRGARGRPVSRARR